jgi:pantoate--beta-alanine ligase
MSSRNTYLDTEQRRAATVLYRALCLARELWSQGQTDTGKIRGEMESLILEEPLAIIDYVSIADAATLEELNRVQPPALVSLAVKVGRTRLIDNVVLE